MKKALLIIVVLTAFFTRPLQIQSEPNNALLEYCTGTWCQWCPCGHDIIQTILTNYPNTVVLGYHGAGSDPWQSYSAGIRGLMGFSAYPTGVIGRKTGILSRSAWNNQVVIQSQSQANISISVSNKNYNSATRQLSLTANVTALQNLTGDYHINFVLTESNMVYPQTGNSSCTGASNYVHKHVVKGMLNGDLGELMNSGGSWNQNVTLSKGLNYIVPNEFIAENCEIAIFVYKKMGSLTTQSEVQQAISVEVENPSSISNTSTVADTYTLSQNFPNPFNPTTNISFSVPKDGHATFKVYDMVGNLVQTYLDGYITRGTYNVQFEGAGLSSGVYFYTLTSGDFTSSRKMLLTK